jgi:hypothetical protein
MISKQLSNKVAVITGAAEIFGFVTYPQYSKNRKKDRSAVVAYCVLGRP